MMISLFAKCLRYLRPYRTLAVLSVVLLVFASAVSLLLPWPLKILVDHVLEGRPLPPPLAAVAGGLDLDRFGLLLLTVAAGLLISLLDNVLLVVANYVNTRIDQNMTLDVRSDLYQQTQRMSLAYHDSRRTGRVVYAINEQGSAVPGLLMTVQPLAQNFLTLAGMFWIVYNIDAQLALLALSVIPFLYYSVGYYAQRVLPQLRQVRNMEIHSLSIVQEALSMLRVILAFGREEYEYRRFREHGEKTVDARVKVTVGETLFSMAVNMSTALGTALILGFGTYRALEGQITVGQLLVVMTYIASVYKPLESISLTVSSLQQNVVALESVFGIIEREPEIRDRPNAVSMDRVSGHIRFEGVHFSYEGRKDTLTDISLEIAPGQLVGIVGPTGAGKSTLVSLIPRFYDPQQGRVVLDGHDIQQLKLASLRDQISIVLQEPLLFSGTIAENIRYGRLDAPMDAVIRAAQDANAHDFIMRLPDGYETSLGERGAQLSGGERQRICVARAFLKDAPILILDEATSSIDSRTESVILEALERLVVGRTTLMIAHRLSTIQNADFIVVIQDGRLVEQGRHEELLLRQGTYAQLYEMQTRQARGKPQPTIERLSAVPGLSA